MFTFLIMVSRYMGPRAQLHIKLAVVGLLLVLLFLGMLSYLYGSLFKSSFRVSSFHVAIVNFDDGVIAQSLNAAVESLRGPSFWNAETFNPSTNPSFDSPEELLEHVRQNDFWAAIYTHANVSNELMSAIDNGTPYNASHAFTLIWNEVKYPAQSDSIILGLAQQLAQVAHQVFNKQIAPTLFDRVNSTNAVSLGAYLNPIAFSQYNIQPTTFGARIFTNTATVAMIILQQFFFNLVAGFILRANAWHIRKHWVHTYLMRYAYSIIYTFLTSLSAAGYIWAFRESWHVNANQFVLTWMVFWLVQTINNLLFWAFLAAAPAPLIPFFVMPWIFLNITSTASPFDLNPGFFRWGYALPSYNAYQVLYDIWSRGANPSLYRTLPILFGWLLILTILCVPAHYAFIKSCRATPPPRGATPDSDPESEPESKRP